MNYKSQLVPLFSFSVTHSHICIIGKTGKKSRINHKIMMSYRYKEHLFFLKEVTQLPQHSSPRFTLGVLCNFILYTLFFFFNPSYRAHLQPSFAGAARPFTAEFCVIPFHRAHHGNLVRPGKNAPQRNNKAVFFPLQKRAQSIWSFSLFQQLVTGMAKHKPRSVWQKPALFIDWRRQEWLNGKRLY